jgi:CheY-like chemotaxis protein
MAAAWAIKSRRDRYYGAQCLKRGAIMARILIVDDEPMIAAMLADWVAELGHEAAGPASNVASALALIESAAPDAAIVDISLGAETGYPIAGRLAEGKIPFFFASGYAEGSLTPPFSGARVITKPFDFAGVQAAVAEMIGKN